MNKKLHLVALVLSVIAFVTCASILFISYFNDELGYQLITLTLTGLSLGLVSINLANYRRESKK